MFNSCLNQKKNPSTLDVRSFHNQNSIFWGWFVVRN